MRVALTIRKPKKVNQVVSDVRTAWCYNPGIFKKTKVESDQRIVKLIE